MRKCLILISFIVFALFSSKIFSQNIDDKQTQTSAGAINKNQPSTNLISMQLVDLAKIYGTLNYLTSLCDVEATGYWHKEMLSALDNIKPAVQQAHQLKKAFNLGAMQYATVYKTCSQEVGILISLTLNKGIILISDIEKRIDS